jgi:hypothetical protein
MSPVVIPLGVERNDVAGEPVEASLPLAHGLRVDAGVPVAWHPQIDLADLRVHVFDVDPLRLLAVPRPAAAWRS